MCGVLNILFIVLLISPGYFGDDVENTAKYWMDKGQDVVKDNLKLDFSMETKKADNIVMVIGSGMSLTTLRAAEIISLPDEVISLSELPIVGFAKTHCADAQVADEACSATTLSTGIKGKTNVVGFMDKTKSDKDGQTIAQWALSAGKDVGLVTTSRITHASIAAMYGHAPSADWEADTDIPHSSHNKYLCSDMACQLIHGEFSRKFKVIFGGGRSNFLPKSSHSDDGRRDDDKNLINDWTNLKESQNVKYEYVRSKDDMKNIKSDTEYVLGLFNDDHMEYNKLKGDDDEPSLKEMVTAAIKILSKNKKGYFLFVLGGRIDHAHHDNRPILAIDETIELFKAVETIRMLTDHNDTLLVVTADHGDTMTISGYPNRNQDILGKVNSTKDGVFYSIPIISYANGPGYTTDVNENVHKSLDRYPANVFMEKETHGGESVAVFASGPWQYLLSGTYDSDLIPHVIGYAACIGPGMHSCGVSSLASVLQLNIFMFITVLLIIFKCALRY